MNVLVIMEGEVRRVKGMGCDLDDDLALECSKSMESGGSVLLQSSRPLV